MNKRIVKYFTPLVIILTLTSCESLSISSESVTSSSIAISTTSASITTSEGSSSSETSSTSISSSSSIDSSSSSATTSSWPSEPLNSVTTLDFYNINDFHGSLAYLPVNAEPGISRLATYFNLKRAANPDGTIITSSGDMWQGSADSNITKGRLVTDALDLIGFDAMAIGNHEFDWGASVISSNRAIADFPFLGANIIEKATGDLPSFAEPYTMIERGGVRIGIIGSIGPYLESSIMPSMIAPYDLADPYDPIVAASEELDGLGAHVKILVNHDGGIPDSVLPYVDAVFNAHSHSFQADMISGVPQLQARSNGRSVAYTQLSYNRDTDKVTILDYGVDDYIINEGYDEDASMAALYQSYYDTEIASIKEEVIGTATADFYSSAVGQLAVTTMLEFGSSFGAIAAFHNTGGIRASIPSGTVTYGDIYKALPFDNDLIVLQLTGSELKEWLARSVYVAGIDSSNRIEATGQYISNSATYKIITISYLSENIDSYPHNVSSEVNTYAYARDLVAAYWRSEGSLNPFDF